jgi:transcriptional regulator with XRE-family HTH domain
MAEKSEQIEENLVKKTCRELGITQKELAEKIGVSQKTINNWVNSRVEIPKNFNRLIELIEIESSYKTIINAIEKVQIGNISTR